MSDEQQNPGPGDQEGTPPRASESQAEAIADHLDERIDDIEGYEVRADAGEEGSVWLAVRGGIDRQELAGDVLEAIEDALRDDGPDLEGAFEFKISMGIAGNDLAFKCEFFQLDAASRGSEGESDGE